MAYTDDLSQPVPTPPHPGEYLREEFLNELGITSYRLAKDIGVDPTRVSQILAGKRAISADTSLRLARYFGTDDGFWVRLQANHDLRLARRSLGEELDRITPFPRPDLEERFDDGTGETGLAESLEPELVVAA